MSAAQPSHEKFHIDVSNPGVDRFSTLPNELLQHIFALAYAKKRPAAPLSRRLRPFYDEVVFRALKAGNDTRVHDLHRILTGPPGCDREASSSAPATRAGSTPILPCYPEAKTVLPASVVNLVINARGDQRRDAYDPAQLGALTQLPNLTALSLDFRSKYQGLEQPSSATSELSLPDVTDLSVGLPKGFSSVNSLLGCFPHLHKLGLTSHKTEPEFASALASIKSPAEIKELTIRASSKKGWRFPDELAAFGSLDSLVLAGQLQHLKEDAYKVLRHAPITTLAVGKKSDIDAEALTALLGEKGLCPTIKTMRLDNISAEEPAHTTWSLLRSSDPYALLRHFVLPKWTAAFSYEGYDNLMSAAATAGVLLQGSVLTAGLIEDRYYQLEEEVLEEDAIGFEIARRSYAAGEGYWD
ncbi:hypothetical protein JCM3774_005638 [Rhodotorula dairenensis]